MASPPTLVSTQSTLRDTLTSPKTLSVTVAVGDVLVVAVQCSNTMTINAPTGGAGFTWALIQSAGAYDSAKVYSATATSAQTFTLSVTTSAAAKWGFTVYRWSASAGIGASNSVASNGSLGAATVGLTTTGTNSAILVTNSDYNAGTGARTWLSSVNAITETVYNNYSTVYTVYEGYHSTSGTPGAKTVGLSAPTQVYTIIAVEILAASQPVSANLTDFLRFFN